MRDPGEIIVLQYQRTFVVQTVALKNKSAVAVTARKVQQ